jgi:hypothetical protein
MWYQNQHWNGSWYGSARPLIRSQIQNIRLRCHGIRLPRARLHEKSSEEGEYINSSFRCSLLPSSPPLSLSFTKKKNTPLLWSVLLFSSSQMYRDIHMERTSTLSPSIIPKNEGMRPHGAISLRGFFVSKIIDKLMPWNFSRFFEQLYQHDTSFCSRHHLKDGESMRNVRFRSLRNVMPVPLMFVLGFKIDTQTGHEIGVRKPSTHSQTQNIRPGCHGFWLARLSVRT